MNFKNEYQKSFAPVKADEEFKKSLIEEMNSATVPTAKKSPYLGMLAVAAAVLLLVGVGYFTGVVFHNGSQESVQQGNIVAENPGISDSVESDTTIDFEGDTLAQPGFDQDVTEFDVSGLSWYGEAEDATEVLEIFISLMEGEALHTVQLASGDPEGESSKLSSKEVDALVEQLQNAEYVEMATSEVMGKEADLYRMDLTDGKKIMFFVTEDGFLMLHDTGDIYRFEAP